MGMYDQSRVTDVYGKLQVLEPEGGSFSDEERMMAVRRPLLAWYREQARVLPWREVPRCGEELGMCQGVYAGECAGMVQEPCVGEFLGMGQEPCAGECQGMLQEPCAGERQGMEQELCPGERQGMEQEMCLGEHPELASTRYPNRQQPDFPYRVWISEIMLQQTRVEAVKPYFERFITALPGIRELAEVPEDQLLKLWEGLGYYSRARNLKKAAQALVGAHGGKLPASYEELLKLPGIGSYTAGAIASIAFGISVPAVDGNVLRVLSRVLASKRDILKQPTKRWLEDLLCQVIPEGHAGDFNQGLIEIGAMVCVPGGQPKCMVCPLASLCIARIQGLISEIPVKTPKKKRKIEEKTVAIIQFEDTLALCKRRGEGLLASLYEFPNVEGHQDEAHLAGLFGLEAGVIAQVECLPPAKHIFSHVEWHMRGYRIVLTNRIPADYITASQAELDQSYPIPGAFMAYRKLLSREAHEG